MAILRQLATTIHLHHQNQYILSLKTPPAYASHSYPPILPMASSMAAGTRDGRTSLPLTMPGQHVMRNWTKIIQQSTHGDETRYFACWPIWAPARHVNYVTINPWGQTQQHMSPSIPEMLLLLLLASFGTRGKCTSLPLTDAWQHE